MNLTALNKSLFFSSLLFLLLVLFPQPAQASFLGDVVNNVKNFFVKEENTEVNTLVIDTDILLTQNGDVTNNKKIDSGDIVKFTYTITNSTDEKYPFSTLDTKIDRKMINFISNVSGVSGFQDDGKNLVFPNIYIYPNQTITISFDARINYFDDIDHTIGTHPVLKRNGKPDIQSEKKEIKVTKLNKEKFSKLQLKINE